MSDSSAVARAKREATEADEALRQLAATATATPAPADPAPAAPSAAAPSDGAPPPAPNPPTPTAAPVDLEERLRAHDQQLRQMQGRLEAAEAERRAALQRGAQLEAELQRAKNTPPPPIATDIPLTDDERKEWGDDFFAIVRKVVAGAVQQPLAEMSKRLASLESKVTLTASDVQSVARATTEERYAAYISALDAQIPGWEAVNDDQKFVDWLDTLEPITRQKYGTLLTSAHNRMDATAVVQIFRLYAPHLAPGSPAAPAPSAPIATTPSTFIDPSTLAAPPTSAQPTPSTTPTPKPAWTAQRVDKLYDDRIKGRISEAEFKALEADMLRAVSGAQR